MTTSTTSLINGSIVSLCLITLTTVVNAAVIVYDGFNYSAGDLSSANTGAAWSRTGSGDSIQIVNGSLTYPGFAGSIGGKAQWGGDGTISRTDFAAVNSGSVFASFLFQVDTLAPITTTGGALAGLVNAGNVANPNSRVYVRRDSVNASAFNLGVLERGSAVTWSAQQLTAGSTHLIVFSLDFIAGANNDTARLWIDPSSSSFGAGSAPAATITASGGIDATSVNRFRLIQNPLNGSAGLQSVDELRIGTTWADVAVAAVPEPTAYALFLGLMSGFMVIRRRR